MIKVMENHLAEIARLRAEQTNVAQRFGCAARELIIAALTVPQGADGDARVGATGLTLWPQLSELHARHVALLAEQERVGRRALAAVDVDADAFGETYRVNEDGVVLRLDAGRWVEAG